MSYLERRVKKIENRLNVNKEPSIVEIVNFGDGNLPPEHTAGGITLRHVHYKDIRKEVRSGKG